MKIGRCLLVLAGLAGLLALEGCATLDQYARALLSLRRLQFKLAGIHSFSLLGIDFTGKSAPADLSPADGLALLQGFRSQRLPAELTLDILVQNPNDGSGGSTRTVSTLTSLESRLLVNGRPTVYGNIEKPVEIPGTGQASTVPVRMSIDLYEFFGHEGYEGLMDLALSLGGRKDAGRVALDAQPRVMSPYGEIVYPGRITIVSTEFR